MCLGNKKDTFDGKIVFTLNIRFCKKGAFNHKKGHFRSFEKKWGASGHVALVPPGSYSSPLLNIEMTMYSFY